MKKKHIILIIIGVIVLLIGMSSLFSDTAKDKNKSNVKQQKKEKYEIVEQPHIVEEGNQYFKTRYIVGTLKNNSQKETSYVQIVFNLYDKDGNVIGSAMTNINHIEKDGTWKFKAIITTQNFSSFKLKSISGF